jgi:hypothetical protein
MRTTAQDHRHFTAKEYKEVVSTFFIVNRNSLSANEKINMRNNVLFGASPIKDKMFLPHRKDYFLRTR